MTEPIVWNRGPRVKELSFEAVSIRSGELLLLTQVKVEGAKPFPGLKKRPAIPD